MATGEAHDQEEQRPALCGTSADAPNAGRKNFNAADDLTLLRCVNLVRPRESAVGTANGIIKAFDTVAEKCRAVEGFVKKEGPALRTRFDRLVRVFRAEQRASLRSSGTTEEHEERDVLLQDIVCRMDNWKEKTEQEKAKERFKNQGIESSGELMRHLAVEEVEDEEEDINGPADRDDVAVGEEVTAQDGHPRDISGRKRAAPAGSRRGTKASKREKLGVVRDSIAQAIEQPILDSSAKYEYLHQRLQFEREEATRKLELEEKRLLAEREREERRQAADQQREQDNQVFMMRLLQIATGKSTEK